MNEQQFASAATSFDQLQSQSVEALQTKLEAHRWWLEDYDEWSLNQDDGVLVIHSNPRGESVVAHAPAQIVGTFNEIEGTWLWGWDNPSVGESLKADATKVLRLGEEKSFSQLTERKLSVDQQEAFGLAAIASHVCGSQGVFSASAGDAIIYINFGEVSLKKADDSPAAAAQVPASNRRLKVLLAIFAALFFLPIIAGTIYLILKR